MSSTVLEKTEKSAPPVGAFKIPTQEPSPITQECIKDLYEAGVINKTAYVALMLKFEGNHQEEFDPEQFAEDITFDRAGKGDKDKTYGFSGSDIETAIAALQKKGALQCEKPPIQLRLGLYY